MTVFASIHNAICAKDDARNGNSLLKADPICVVSLVEQPQMCQNLLDLAGPHHKRDELPTPAAVTALQGIGLLHPGDLDQQITLSMKLYDVTGIATMKYLAEFVSKATHKTLIAAVSN